MNILTERTIEDKSRDPGTRQRAMLADSGFARSPVMRRLYELAESRGVLVVWYPLPEKVNGFYFRTPKGRPVVCLNVAMRGRLRSFVFAHELGHFCLNNGLGFQVEGDSDERREILRRVEEETDRFAHRLLYFIRRGLEARGATA